MKYLLLPVTLFLLSFTVCGQVDSIPAKPYQRFPTVPPFRLLLSDSVTYFTKDDLPRKKAVLVILFSPDCDHCQQQTRDIISAIDQFSGIQIVMGTLLPFPRLKSFYEEYGLASYPGIAAGKDVSYLLPDFFGAHSLPVLGFYDRRKKLIMVHEGTMTVPAILAKFKQ